jgi:hypothetical protein
MRYATLPSTDLRDWVVIATKGGHPEMDTPLASRPTRSSAIWTRAWRAWAWNRLIYTTCTATTHRGGY